MWETYESVPRGPGVPHVHDLHIETRDGACSTRAMRVLEDATAVFFTGGDRGRVGLRDGVPVVREKWLEKSSRNVSLVGGRWVTRER